MISNDTLNDLNQAFLYYTMGLDTQQNSTPASLGEQDVTLTSLQEMNATVDFFTGTEEPWPVNNTSETFDLRDPVTASLSVTEPPDWLGLHKMLLEFSSLQFPAILVSPALLVLAMAASEVAYRVVLANVLPGLFRDVLLDFLSAGEASLLSWEALTLFHAYGLPVWTMATYLTLVTKAYRYRAECIACPYTHILSCLSGQLSWRRATLRIAGQLAAGSAYFHLLAGVWDLGLTPIHVGRSYWMAYGRCATWLEVATWAGFLYESAGAMVCGLASGLLYDVQLWPRFSLHVRVLANCLVTLCSVLAAFHHTGGFFQPLLAYTRTLGCVGVLREVRLIDHLVVYWAGATAGAVAAMYSGPLVRRLAARFTPAPRPTAELKVERLESGGPSSAPELENHHHAHNT
jgi:hypothetical protein